MAEDSTVDLIRLADEETSFRVRILGRHMPGVLPWHDFLDAEIVVTSGFAQGHMGVCLSPNDVDHWSRALEALAAGRDVCWMDDGRNPEIRVEQSGQNGVPSVAVEDVAGSGTSVCVLVWLADGWAAEQHEHLRRVRAAWPWEVVETSPGVYVWRR
ncbi:hypothetical protein F4561_002447 [Lipingzhangella halophila]|uniref:Uncharacterized protein n=1 Tax=Lipingzhangella halophila TaxID=1783352 RepID=A0A7W7RGU0_9ACTN|nr:DUF5959 family protein [Lipingzhangella halophila]MBB4931627.1 hypothetical protein [Lipingzhangella halophila]